MTFTERRSKIGSKYSGTEVSARLRSMLAVPEAQLGSVCFDDRYIEGLRGWNAEAEAQFVAYFRVPIWLKARRQLRSPDLVEDACQETLLRVLRYFRSGKGLDNPDRLPAFVHSVCHNVTLEMIRPRRATRKYPENGLLWAPTFTCRWRITELAESNGIPQLLEGLEEQSAVGQQH